MATIEAMVASRLSEQLRNQQHGLPAGTSSPSPAFPSFESDGSDLKTPTKAQSPSKSRSMSDSTPRLSPSPNIKSTVRRSKDDHTISAAPQTPRRPEVARGLSLQMPIKHDGKSPFTGVVPTPGPLSPKLDSRSIHGSPAALPRHSRGLDFSRACTNLHHSTLAEQSSPDSSPTITQKGIPIPIKSSLSMNSMILDSPQMHGSSWSQGGNADRSMVSGSVSSVNMLDSSSSDSDGDDAMEHDDNEDLMISTPQAYKLMDGSAPTPFPNTMAAPKPVYWPNPSGGAPHSFMSFHRARMRHRRSRQSSSSASGHSSLASPIPQSPPNGRADGYFGRDAALKKVASRRESLSLGTNDLHISSGSGNDSGDEAGQSGVSTPNVVQRPVTRRGNLLPKTRAFGRIRAALFEESAPVDAESKREAEVIRQVRESDPDGTTGGRNDDDSPQLAPEPTSLDALPEAPLHSNGAPKGLFGAFSRQAIQNSVHAGKEFWQKFDGQYRTPPPPIFPRHSSSALSDEINMDSPTTTSSTPSASIMPTSGPQPQEHRDSASRSSTPQPAAPPPSAAEGIRKRRRDDDLDGHSIKRRAVSPGMSVQNSPILSQSPSQREASLWGPAPPKINRESSISGPAAGERTSSNGSTASAVAGLGQAGKRVGMQGMTDTNDGLMKMSIE